MKCSGLVDLVSVHRREGVGRAMGGPRGDSHAPKLMTKKVIEDL